jgi:transcriptional regulator with XRE-family HTH domain
MKDPKQKLTRLIRDAAEKKGCSKSQVSQILALVENTMSDGIPDIEELQRILKGIGGLEK